MEFSHVSVLLHETVDGAFTDPKGVYADLTTGGGGHSLELAKRLDGGRLICFDQDREALEAAGERLKGYPVTFVRSNFSEIKSVLAELGVNALDGIIADLGVSSHQLDTAERGFSFHNDAPLDMRMSGEGLSARDVVNEYGEEEIARILFDYGEEKFGNRIARGIVNARLTAPIETTGQLAEIIKASVPAAYRREKNPCRKSFQAIRIEVNHELDVLETALTRQNVGDHIPFAGGQNSQEPLQGILHRLHLSAGIPGVRMRKEAHGQADGKEACDRFR